MKNNKQIELLKDLWNSNDILRPNKIIEYGPYILSMVFYKYLSDRAVRLIAPAEITDPAQVQAAYEKAYEETEIREKLGYVIEPRFTFTALVTRADQQLEMLAQAFAKIEATDEFYRDIFSELELNSKKLGQKRTQIVLEIIKTSAKLNNVEYQELALSDIYTGLLQVISQSAGTKGIGLYSPASVNELMSKLLLKELAGKSEFTVYDPTMWSGTLLLELQKYSDALIKYYGQEGNSELYDLARMNFIIHGVNEEEQVLNNGDALGDDWPNNGELDFYAVLMNPPFSERWHADKALLQDPRYERYGVLAPKAKADFAYLLQGLHHLKEKGTMAIILPHGILFRGNAEEKLRRQLINENVIDTIIGLPSNLFHYMNIPTAIVILKKDRATKDILFIDASAEFDKGRIQNTMNAEQIEKVLDAYVKRADIDKFAHVASYEEIFENEFNLNISRYVDTFEEEAIAMDTVVADLKAAQVESKRVQANLYHSLEKLVDEYGESEESIRLFLKGMKK